MQSSPLSSFIVDKREFLVKRDDLIDPFLAGNKYRKLYKLLKTPKERYHTLISYGGTQSNAMLALAALTKKKGWRFCYYTKPLSSYQKTNPTGNYAQALKLGMEHIELTQELYRDYIASLSIIDDEGVVVVAQGGAVAAAQKGLEVLADELRNDLALYSDVKAIATPSGTGTTAFFLAKALPAYSIYTTPSVGDAGYLKEQMHSLGEIPSNLLVLEPKKKYHFAKPYGEFYEIYQKLLHAGIEFDLLYAPLLWQELLSQTEQKICYVHSGGVSGNSSMLQRYRKKIKNIDNI